VVPLPSLKRYAAAGPEIPPVTVTRYNSAGRLVPRRIARLS
jgi:hypothetical protein